MKIDETTTHSSNGVSRRGLLKGAAAIGAASTLGSFNINHAWSKDVTYDGEIFDAGGATLRVAEWGGFWEDNVRKLMANQFEKDFNCKLLWDGTFPWYPKFMAAGAKDPVIDIYNQNTVEIVKVAKAGDFFMPLTDVLPNVPNSKGLWPFATANNPAITWAFGGMCYTYRKDLVEAPKSFKDFWDPRFVGKRGTYITGNPLFMLFLLTANSLYGKDQYDLAAGYAAMKQAMPMKVTDFTGTMQTLLERGEVQIGVEIQGETYMLQDRGVKVDLQLWNEKKPIISQNKAISRYTDPMRKKLALALLNRTISPEFMTAFDQVFYYSPTHKDAKLPPNMASKGMKNDAESNQGFWEPDWAWYLDHEDDIVEAVNGIYGG